MSQDRNLPVGTGCAKLQGHSGQQRVLRIHRAEIRPRSRCSGVGLPFEIRDFLSRLSDVHRDIFFLSSLIPCDLCAANHKNITLPPYIRYLTSLWGTSLHQPLLCPIFVLHKSTCCKFPLSLRNTCTAQSLCICMPVLCPQGAHTVPTCL